MFKRLAIVCLVLVLVPALGGCGYRFRGQDTGLPPDIRTVAIPVFRNNTNEAGLEDIMTRALILEFNRNQVLKLVKTDQADVVVKGTIRSSSSTVSAYSGITAALVRRVAFSVDIILVRARGDKIIKQFIGMSDYEDFDVVSDAAATEANRQKALERVAKDIAAIAHDALFTNF